jgi:hypothetical protein
MGIVHKSGIEAIKGARVTENFRTIRCAVLSMLSAVLLTAPNGASAEVQANKSCEIHAIAMVAEMKAGAAKPMSEEELSLVRATAIKSCLAQSSGNSNTVATTQPAAAVLPQSTVTTPQTKSDTSFFGTLGAIFNVPSTRKPGNERLLDRGRN